MNIRRVVNALLIAWFVITPFFWSLNLSKGTYGFYDTFNMAPYSVFHAAIFYLLMLTSIHISKCSLFHVLLLTLYFPCILLINYPYLTFRDVYLHSAPAETILVGGNLNYLRDPTPEYWPSSFIFNALSAVVLGCDLVTSNYVLFFCLILALALVTYSIAKFSENRGYLLALATAPLFVALFDFEHYARCHHSFILIFYLIFSFIRLKDRRGLLFQLLVIISIVTLHPFNSLYVTIFSFSYISLTTLYRKFPKRNETALFSSTAFLGWWLFQAGPSLEDALPWIKTVLSPKYIEPVIRAQYVTTEPLPLWGVILRSYWKYSLLALLMIGFLSSIVLLLRHLQKRENESDMPSVIITFTSVLVASGLFLFIILLLPAWTIYRFTMYAAFPAAFSSLLCLEKLIKINRKKTLLKRKAIGFILLIFIISLSFTTLLLKFERNQYFGEIAHPSEFKALSFLFTYEQSPCTIVASPLTSIYSCYLDYNSVHRISHYPAFGDKLYIELMSDPTKLLPILRVVIGGSDFVVRGMRDELYLSDILQEPTKEERELRVKQIDIDIILPNFNRIYDNCYYYLARAHTRGLVG